MNEPLSFFEEFDLRGKSSNKSFRKSKFKLKYSFIQDTYENQESKTSKRRVTYKRCHRIGHYAKTCTIEL
jgi:hypothetical protein